MKSTVRIASGLLLFNGVSALFGGLSLITDPTGSDLKMSPQLLEHSPFKDFLIPGLVLFISVGLFSMLTFAWTIMQWRNFAWMIMVEGGMVLGWILVQIVLIRHFNYLQAVYGGMGIALLWLGWKLRNHG